MDAKDRKTEEELLQEYLKEHGIRYSVQREQILEVFMGIERHISIEELYDEVRRKYPHIGSATVYRAMKILCAAQIAEALDFGDGIKRFEHKYGHSHHDHLVCTECGAFIEVYSKELEKLQEKLALSYQFIVSNHKLQIFGKCKDCQ